MRTVLIFLIPFLLFAKPFKVASYNVENLFDAVYDATEYEEFIPGRHGWSSRMAERKLAHTAEVICDLDADIIGLQEIENAHAFGLLRRTLERVGCAYRYGAITHKRGAPIQVALLSRFPIVRQQDIQVSYAPRVRNILEVTVNVHGVPLTLYVNHWKSKGGKGYESKRLAYARVLQKRIDKLPKTKEYIILGDLNTNYDAHLTLLKRLDDTNGKRGLQHLLHTVKGERHVTEDEVRAGQKGIHYDLWLELPFRERWSHKFYGRKSTLDHILLPASMFDGRGIDYVNDSFGVFKPRYLFTKKGYINRWELKGGKHTGKGYSDHLPIFALFDTKPYVPSDHNENKAAQTGSIETLYTKAHLEAPLKLENVVVLLKRGRYGVIKQSPKGRGVFLYGAVQGLKEGHRYDVTVQDIHTYKGLKEITALVKTSDRGSTDLSAYYGTIEHMRQNEVVRGLTGVYQRGYFYTDGKKIPIYFKNRKLTPPNGAKLKIAIAHIGYYKRLQLVVYSKRDFTILE
ncbi:MAG: endonuclease/exonuclease/phosphatase family protein [Sulfurovum sp.]|nr:endonuclease/exonuclease/phosphatase family protein [Sulfurovum sp.]